MLGLIRKMCIVLLSSIVNASNHTKYISLSNQKWIFQRSDINWHPNEYSQDLLLSICS